MKKVLLCTLFILLITIFTGCRKNLELKAENVETNTIVVKKDGSAQAAIVDVFDKDYYSLQELTDFMNEEINSYNEENGEDVIILDEIEEIDGKVILILTYSSLSHYSAFNHIETQLVSAKDARNGDINLPDVLSNKKEESISKETALEKDNYKVFGIKEDTNVVIDGKIMYYSNGEFIDSSKIKANGEDETIIVYKP
jgi:hypothetical protein